MGFSDRLAQADTVARILDDLWNSPPLSGRLFLVRYGYETHIPADVRTRMRFLRTETSKHVRFRPDYFVIDSQRIERMYLLEYKATQTPLYSQNRIGGITRRAAELGRPGLTWQDIGQMEADAYDSYAVLHDRLNVRVAILNYCAYHGRPLLCDFIENIPVLHRDQVTTQTTAGSRTPFVNFDCTGMRDFVTFIRDEHGLEISPERYAAVLRSLADELPVTHAAGSPLHPDRANRAH